MTAAFHPLRDVKASVSFPKMDLHYWSSVGKHRGVECSLEGASLTINYLLKLVPLDSGLVQRPRANWTVVSCRGKVRNLVAHVKQRSERKDTDQVDHNYAVTIMSLRCMAPSILQLR